MVSVFKSIHFSALAPFPGILLFLVSAFSSFFISFISFLSIFLLLWSFSSVSCPRYQCFVSFDYCLFTLMVSCLMCLFLYLLPVFVFVSFAIFCHIFISSACISSLPVSNHKSPLHVCAHIVLSSPLLPHFCQFLSRLPTWIPYPILLFTWLFPCASAEWFSRLTSNPCAALFWIILFPLRYLWSLFNWHKI